MNEGYKELAAAIIKQCLLDYKEALQTNALCTMLECEKFLRSQWFAFLSDMDGERLIKKMREEFA